MQHLNQALISCYKLKVISWNKNSFCIEENIETVQNSDTENRTITVEDNLIDKVTNNSINMAHLVADMVQSHYLVEYVCLAHCHIGELGIRVLTERLQITQIRYINISWCRLTAAAVPDLRRFFINNKQLEKCLMQHNECGDEKSMKFICQGITDHPSLKYLDISANNV